MRDFLYVDDCVEALLLSAISEEAGGKAFNVGGVEAFTLKEVAEILIEVNGGGDFRCMEFPQDRARIDIGDYYSDSGLIKNTIGWKPEVSLKEGLEKTVAYYREYLSHYI